MDEGSLHTLHKFQLFPAALLPVSSRGPARTVFHHTAWLVRPQILLHPATGGSEHGLKSPLKACHNATFYSTLDSLVCASSGQLQIEKERNQTNHQHERNKIKNHQRLPCPRWHYPAMEQITVLTFKALLWLPMTAGNSIISSSRDNLSIQQSPTNSCEIVKLKLNWADEQLLKRQHLFTSTLLIILILSVFLLVSRYQIHTNPPQTQLQQSTDRRAPLLLSGLFSQHE